MKQYIISISDDSKAAQIISFLNDLSYVKVITSAEQEQDLKPESKRFPLMDSPFNVENFKRYSREELYE